MESFEESPVSERDWYERARTKAEEIIADLDPALHVEVVPVEVTTTGKNRYHTLSLRFTSSSDPTVNWTMEIGQSDGYIAHELGNTIRKIYREHAEKRRRQG